MNAILIAAILLWGQLCPNGVCPTPTKEATSTAVPTTPVPTDEPAITPTPTLPFDRPTPTNPAVKPTEKPTKPNKGLKGNLPSMGFGPAPTAVPVGGIGIVSGVVAVSLFLLTAILGSMVLIATALGRTRKRP